MLTELWEDVSMAMGKKKTRRSRQCLTQLGLVDIDTGDDRQGRHCGLLQSVGAGLEFLRQMTGDRRETYLKITIKFSETGRLVSCAVS
jgi:hypothetical protein